MRKIALLLFLIMSCFFAPASAWAADDGHWQQLMRNGVSKWENGPFEKAEEELVLAVPESKVLGPAYVDLTVARLGDVLEGLGKYDAAEKLYRDLVNSGTDPKVIGTRLAELLDKKGLLDQGLYSTYSYDIKAQDDKATSRFMRGVQSAMWRAWSTSSLGIYSEAVVFMRVDRSGTVGPIFLLQSSGLRSSDKAATKAVLRAHLPALPSSFSSYVEIRFSFVRNPQAGINPDKERTDRINGNKMALLSWQEKELGKQHPQLAVTLQEMAVDLERVKEYERAEKVYRSAKRIWDESKIECVQRAYGLRRLAHLMARKKKYSECVDLLTQAVSICEKRYSPCSGVIQEEMALLADSLKHLHRNEEANMWERKLEQCAEHQSENTPR